MSVDALASRPTGPAVTARSAPILNWFFTSCSRPRWLLMTSTRSMACAPNCAPMLPPVMVRNAGDDQPPCFWLRTLSTPRPRWPPTTRPPLISDGNTAMPSAFSMIDRGTALSPAAMISSSTIEASAIRLASSEACAITTCDTARVRTTITIFFIVDVLLRGAGCEERARALGA